MRRRASKLTTLSQQKLNMMIYLIVVKKINAVVHNKKTLFHQIKGLEMNYLLRRWRVSLAKETDWDVRGS